MNITSHKLSGFYYTENIRIFPHPFYYHTDLNAIKNSALLLPNNFYVRHMSSIYLIRASKRYSFTKCCVSRSVYFPREMYHVRDSISVDYIPWSVRDQAFLYIIVESEHLYL